MLKFRIHYTLEGTEDSFEVEEETIEEIKIAAKEQTDKRFLNEKEHNLWSEKIEN